MHLSMLDEKCISIKYILNGIYFNQSKLFLKYMMKKVELNIFIHSRLSIAAIM